MIGEIKKEPRLDPPGPHHATLLSQHGAFPKIYQVCDPGASVSRGHNIADGRTDGRSLNRDT